MLVALGYDTAKTLAQRLEFEPRQGAYYLNAACSIGLLEAEPFRLTALGRQYVANPALREAILTRAVLGVPLIAELLISLLLAPGGQLEKSELTALLRRSTELGESTAARRAQTLWAWLAWVAEHGGSFQLQDDRITLLGPGLPRPPGLNAPNQAQADQLNLF